MTDWGMFEKCRDGDILHVRSNSALGKMIRWALNKWLKRLCQQQMHPVPKCGVWGNHDGLIVRNPDTGMLMVCESMPGGTQLTELSDYVLDVQAGKCHVRILRPLPEVATAEECSQAAQNCLTNELGKPYDYAAYPRLLFKAVVGDWVQTVAGWKWADWCTQEVQQSYMAVPPEVDLFQTLNPTPMTVEQMAGWVPAKFGKRITLAEVK